MFIKALPISIAFKYESLQTWLTVARSIVQRLVRFYSKDFSQISVDHPEHAHMVSVMNMSFLPRSEAETAFAGYYVTSEPCTPEKPYV